MRFLTRIVLALVPPVVLGGLIVRPVWSQFDEMVKHVPSNANSLCLVNAEKVFNSAFAKSGGWQEQRGKRFESGLTFLPPKATRMVVGSQLDLEVMRSTWDVAVIELPKAPSLADVGKYFGGIEDAIGKTPALRVADDSYVVRFSDTLIGAFGPAIVN